LPNGVSAVRKIPLRSNRREEFLGQVQRYE
jgi:hypothetical protein